MSKRIYNKLNVGDLFTVQSSAGGYYIGQVIYKRDELDTVFVYFFDIEKIASEELPETFDATVCDIVSGFFITIENLIKNWKIVGNQKYREHPVLEKVERVKAHNFNGTRTIGGGNVARYLDTYFGVIDASSWPDPSLILNNFIAK